MDTFTAVRACAEAILGGAVLQATVEDGAVSAGRGQIIDWRTVRSGDLVQEGGDAFDTAQLFVALVGPAAALASVTPAEPAVPEITAFMANEHGSRARAFTAPGGFRILVERHDDDAAQADFTAKLAALVAEHF